MRAHFHHFSRLSSPQCQKCHVNGLSLIYLQVFLQNTKSWPWPCICLKILITIDDCRQSRWEPTRKAPIRGWEQAARAKRSTTEHVLTLAAAAVPRPVLLPRQTTARTATEPDAAQPNAPPQTVASNQTSRELAKKTKQNKTKRD